MVAPLATTLIKVINLEKQFSVFTELIFNHLFSHCDSLLRQHFRGVFVFRHPQDPGKEARPTHRSDY